MAPDAASGRATRPSLLRPLALCGLLVAEYLALSLSFDARALHALGGPLRWFGLSGDLATLLGLAAGATVVLAPAATRSALLELVARAPAAAGSKPHPWRAWLVHAIAYATLFGASQIVFGGATHGRAPGAPWLLLWLAAALTVAVSWIAVAAPFGRLLELLPTLRGPALIGSLAGAVAWLGAWTSTQSWRWLQPLTLRAVTALVRPWAPGLVVDLTTSSLGTARFAVEVGPQCSGIEGLGLMVVFLAGYLFLSRSRLRVARALLVLPATLVVVFAANAVRIAALIALGTYVSPALAVSGFHSKAGWLLFCAIALVAVAVVERVGRTAETNTTVDPTAASHLLPLMTLIAVGLVTGLFVVHVDWLYGLRIAGALLTLLWFRRAYAALWIAPAWSSVVIGALVFGLWRLLAPGADAVSVSYLALGLEQSGPLTAAAWLALRTAGSVLVVPVCEELAFRGYLLRRLTSRDVDAVDVRRVHAWAWLGSSAAFAALHSDVVAALVAGLAYALAQQRRGRLTDAIVAHAVTNLLIALEALLLGDLRYWA